MIDNPPIDFLRYSHIKTTIASFHVESWNLATFGRNNSHATIGITQDKQSLWLNRREYSVHRNDHISYGLSTTAARGVEKMIRFADPEILEKYFIQLVIVILTCVDQYVIAILIQRSDDTRQANDFRTGAYYSDDFQLFHCDSHSQYDQASVPTGIV
ncbi:hypothetical protein D3C72_1900190 [compost metagenome]